MPADTGLKRQDAVARSTSEPDNRRNMPLSILWENERGETLEHCVSVFVTSDYIQSMDKIQNTCCLRFIDEYGDTTFNQHQLPVLLEELRGILPHSKDANARRSLESIMLFIRKAEGSIHTYIKFVGD